MRPPEEIIPGKPLFYATSMTNRGVRPVCWLRATWDGRRKLKAIPSIQAASAATDVFNQASILTLYDPDRSQTVIHEGRIERWAAFSDGDWERESAQIAPRGAGLRILTETVTSPSLAGANSGSTDAVPRGEVASVRALHARLRRTTVQ